MSCPRTQHNTTQFPSTIKLENRKFAYITVSPKIQSSKKSWHACPLLQYLSWKFISSPPSPQFNVVYRDEVVIARFQHCQGGRGLLIPVIPLVIVSKIACQRMFQFSDPGVPSTFVEDCRCPTETTR